MIAVRAWTEWNVVSSMRLPSDVQVKPFANLVGASLYLSSTTSRCVRAHRERLYRDMLVHTPTRSCACHTLECFCQLCRCTLKLACAIAWEVATAARASAPIAKPNPIALQPRRDKRWVFDLMWSLPVRVP